MIYIITTLLAGSLICLGVAMLLQQRQIRELRRSIEPRKAPLVLTYYGSYNTQVARGRAIAEDLKAYTRAGGSL